MNLTQAQLATLKTWLDTNASSLDDEAAAALLNATANPDFWVWRTSLSEQEAVQSTSVDGTTFTWVGNGFISRSVGEQAAWGRLFAVGLNPSLASVRNAFSDILSGTGNAAANRTHLLTVARRKATVGEQLFATGTGSTGSPATLAGSTAWPLGGLGLAEGKVTVANVSEARNL